ncbi:MAG: hypothetical protein ACR2QU_11285 [Gammaproteobacteria bacterium]
MNEKDTETVVLDEELVREIVDDEGRKRKGKEESRLVRLDRDQDESGGEPASDKKGA